MSDEPLPQSEIILYRTEDGRTRVQYRFENETLWLTQALIAELFQVTVPTVNEHLKGGFAVATGAGLAVCGGWIFCFCSRGAGGRVFARTLCARGGRERHPASQGRLLAGYG